MNFDYTPKMKDWIRRVGEFMDRYVYPAEKTYNDQMLEARAKGNPWIVVPVVDFGFGSLMPAGAEGDVTVTRPSKPARRSIVSATVAFEPRATVTSGVANESAKSGCSGNGPTAEILTTKASLRPSGVACTAPGVVGKVVDSVVSPTT